MIRRVHRITMRTDRDGLPPSVVYLSDTGKNLDEETCAGADAFTHDGVESATLIDIPRCQAER